MKKNLVKAAEGGDRLETLIALRDLLANRLQNTTSSRDISSMSRRLMQCISEIEVIEKQREALRKNSASLEVMRNLAYISSKMNRGHAPGRITDEHENF